MLDFLFDVRDYAYLVYQWARQHPEVVVVVSFGLLLTLIGFELNQLRRVVLRAQRGTKMSREDYEQEMRANLILSSGVVDVIDSAYLKGFITNKQRRDKLKSLGKAWNMDDMLVTGLVQLRGRSLKRMIKRRLKEGFWRKPVPDLAKNPSVSPRSELLQKMHEMKLFKS